MTTGLLRVQVPQKLAPVFTGTADYRIAYGGRGSGKTYTFAKMAAVRALEYAQSGITGIIGCAREFMNSLEESSMAEIKAAILSDPILVSHFEIGEKYIKTKDGRIEFIFFGLRRNLDSVKSKSRLLILWVDEAETVSEIAWRKAVPTVREEGSEIWVTWNPESPESATHNRFRETPPPNSKIAEVNWQDNPWFPLRLNRTRLEDKRTRPEEYNHVWNGGFLEIGDAQIFKRTVIGRLPVSPYDVPLFGMDFGFSNDPTAIIKLYVFLEKKQIYIAKEAFGQQIETIELPALLNEFNELPLKDGMGFPIICDSSRPETISHLVNSGFDARASKKGPHSIKEGIDWLRGFEIYIDPECPNMQREANFYRWKQDKDTGKNLPIPLDKDNHGWDAVRYAVEETRLTGGDGTHQSFRF